MNGPQDAGGRHGFGPVIREENEPLFHADWERRILAMAVAAGGTGKLTGDQNRFARENCPPEDYYRMSYYQIWTRGLETVLQDLGLVTAEELAEGRMITPLTEEVTPLSPERAPHLIATGAPPLRDPGTTKPAFAVGDRVRARNYQPRGHTRLPSYCRNREGVVTAVRGYHLFPDTSAQGDRDTAHWLYNVTFTAQELFGDTAEASDTVSPDLWEPYLDAV